MKKEKIMCLCIIVIVGCCFYEDKPPSTPVGVSSITGDEKITLYWYENQEKDLAGYYIYRSLSLEGEYEKIGSSTTEFFVDFWVTNGITYYYAVSAFDKQGNESEPSNPIFDTPRPEGFGVKIWDAHVYPEYAGFDFSRESVQEWDNPSTDIYCVYDRIARIFYMKVADRFTQIQDFGYIENIDDIDYAPEEGWSEIGQVELILGHGYIVWTRDNHFAKFRITRIGDGYVKFDWAYQIDRGNRELSYKNNNLAKMQERRSK